MIKICSRVIGGIGAAALVLGLGTAVNAQSITIGTVEAAPGQIALLPVTWTAGSSGATGLTVDVGFGDQPFDGGATPNCDFTTELLAIKSGSMFALRPPRCTVGGDPACTAVRAGIVDFGANNATVIPDQTLFTCAFVIPEDAEIGDEFAFTVDTARFIVPSGAETEITNQTDGLVRVADIPPTVTAPPTATATPVPAGTATNTPRPTGVGGGGGGDDDGCQVVAGSQSNAAWLLLIPAAVLLVQRRRSR